MKIIETRVITAICKQCEHSGVLCRTKYKFNLVHKAVYNYVMAYLIALTMTGPEVLEDPENKLINPWLKCNPITLDRMMINIWIK